MKGKKNRWWNVQLYEFEWIMWLTAPARLTLPERLDSSSPPMILTLLLLSFYKTETPSLPHPEQGEVSSVDKMDGNTLVICISYSSTTVNEMGGQAYTVALYSNEIHRQWDWFIVVLVQRFYIVQEVRKELVAPFQHAESNNVVPPHVSDYISSQSLSPEPKTPRRKDKRRHVDDKCVHMNAIWSWLEACFWASFACSPALDLIFMHLT